MKLTAKDYVTVDEGEYPAAFAGYEEKTTEFGDAILMAFTLRDEEHNGVEIKGLASKKLSPKSKLRGWIEGMVGHVLEAGEDVDLDDLVGRKVMLYISVADTDKGMFNRIEKIRIPKRKAKPVPVVEDEDEDETPKPAKNGKAKPATEEEGDPF